MEKVNYETILNAKHSVSWGTTRTCKGEQFAIDKLQDSTIANCEGFCLC